MASVYPGALDTLATNKADATTTATDHAAHHNDLADAVNKIEAELGINPSALLLGRWVPLMFSHVNLTAAAAGTYLGHLAVTEDAAGSIGTVMQYLDPADLAITGKTLQYRVVAMFMQNTTANAGTSVATAGLYPMTAGGATATFTPTAGTVVTGSTAARTGGGASSEARVISSTFTAPVADTYALGVAITVATTAGATRIGLRLDYRYA